jgi:NADPH:quinone reductase-like Zn-dependent oxidoreductase
MESIPEIMAAVLLTGHGGFDQLEYRTDVPVPALSKGEVLIKVGAAGVNNTDINTRIGWYSKSVTSDTHAGAAEGSETANDEDIVFENLIRYIESGEIRPVVAKTYPLIDIVAAQKDFLTKNFVGKIVLIPNG